MFRLFDVTNRLFILASQSFISPFCLSVRSKQCRRETTQNYTREKFKYQSWNYEFMYRINRIIGLLDYRPAHPPPTPWAYKIYWPMGLQSVRFVLSGNTNFYGKPIHFLDENCRFLIRLVVSVLSTKSVDHKRLLVFPTWLLLTHLVEPYLENVEKSLKSYKPMGL